MQNRINIRDLVQLSRSALVKNRLRALAAMRNQLCGGRPKGYIDIARRMLIDRSEDCRWQAGIVIGEYLDSDRLSVWDIVEEYIRRRTTIADEVISTVLIEHLLERDFELFFSKLTAMYREGCARVPTLLQGCWAFGEAQKHWNEVEEFLSACGNPISQRARR